MAKIQSYQVFHARYTTNGCAGDGDGHGNEDEDGDGVGMVMVMVMVSRMGLVMGVAKMFEIHLIERKVHGCELGRHCDIFDFSNAIIR